MFYRFNNAAVLNKAPGCLTKAQYIERELCISPRVSDQSYCCKEYFNLNSTQRESVIGTRIQKDRNIKMKQDNSTKAAQLLLGYARLSNTEAIHFTKGMNQFIFASPSQKRQMMECWKQQGQALPDEQR
ncbi:hypothetical protein [Herbaspirillum autotrophicum]|uniref:hypothetical protein n=1 Tax=Herbaspirillum autotrophicum TaxID=180195 RepID=UPI0012EE20FA|nr:hypothetical protein [Herbaspirillum autotrophicum]